MFFLYMSHYEMSTFHVKLHCKSEVSTKYNIKLCINCTSTLNVFFLYMRMSTFHVKLHCKSEVSTKYNIKLCINCTSTLNGFFVYEDVYFSC